MKITGFDTFDVRFPTSRTLAGSDAMNPTPTTPRRTWSSGPTRPIPRWPATGSRSPSAGATTSSWRRSARWRRSLAGRDLDEVAGRPRRPLAAADQRQPSCAGSARTRAWCTWPPARSLNAVWDLAARRAGQPLWRLLARDDARRSSSAWSTSATCPTRSPRTRRWRCSSAARRPGRPDRGAAPRRLPRLHHRRPAGSATPTSKLAALCREAVADGFGQVKLKVGAALEDDMRRCAIAREAIGEETGLAIDANQVWDVPTGDRVDHARSPPFQPVWIEEPTARTTSSATRRSAGRVRPIRVATGEHVANPVMFKQLLQAGAIDFCRSTPAAWPGSTRTSPSCCWRPSSACRSARTPAASGCASWSSTCRCSTTWRCPARPKAA